MSRSYRKHPVTGEKIRRSKLLWWQCRGCDYCISGKQKYKQIGKQLDKEAKMTEEKVWVLPTAEVKKVGQASVQALGVDNEETSEET